MKFIHLPIVALCVCSTGFSSTPQPLQFTDADGKTWTLNQTSRVTVVISSSDSTASQTRAVGRTLYPFQGREDFRAVVVICLQKSLARHVRGFTLERIRADLDAEAKRIAPYYKEKSNPANPREHIGAIADFDGAVARALGWSEDVDSSKVRVVIFDHTGQMAARFDPANDLDAIRCKVAELLKVPCPDDPTVPQRNTIRYRSTH